MAGLASSSARAARADDPQAFRWMRAARVGPLLMLLVIMPLHAAPLESPASGPPAGRLVKDMALASAFRTIGDWHLAVYEPEDTPEGDPPDKAAQLCLTGPNGAGTVTQDCIALTATVAGVSTVYNLQTVDSVVVTPIPTTVPGGSEPALLVRASFSGGGSGTLTKLFVWTYVRVDATPFNHGPGGFFMEVFSSVIANGGEQRFFLSGPLAGCFVSAEQVFLAGPTMADPQPFNLRVYRRADVGFVPVLGLLTARAYPTIRGGDPPANPIEREMARVLRARVAVYPCGWPR